MPDPEDLAEPPAPAEVMANLNVNRPATSIPCNNFNSDVDHLPDFIPIFENACIVATNPSDDRKDSTFLQWFPIKLDKRARDLFKSINQANKSWAAIWAELKELLIDPQERYNWKAKKSTIKWDGKETFHALETRIKRAVDLFEDPAVVKSEYFFRFRAALPKEYRQAIDLGCEEDARTIENAKKCALRLQLALADDDDNATSSKNVAFSGAAMADEIESDCIEALEMSVQEMSLQMEEIRDSLAIDQNRRGPDRRDDTWSSRRRDYSQERNSPCHDDVGHSRHHDNDYRRRDESRGYGRSRDHDRYDRSSSRYDSRDRRSSSRYDSRDRRSSSKYDNRDRHDSRDGRDNYSRDSYHHDGRDHRGDPNRHDSRDGYCRERGRGGDNNNERWDHRDYDRDYRSRERSPDRSSDDDYD